MGNQFGRGAGLGLALFLAGGMAVGCGSGGKDKKGPDADVTFNNPAPEPVNSGGVPPTPEPVETIEVYELVDIHFDFDRYAIRSQDRETLAAHARWLSDNPEVNVMIEGHCDERGTVEYNLALGEKRASAARAFLVNYGVADNRLDVISYGKERPLDPRHSEAAWAKNRRATFVKR